MPRPKACCGFKAAVGATTRVLIVGVSARGMAESAVRTGYSVSAIDGFADLDLAAICHARRVSPYTAGAVADHGRAVDCDAICYVSNLENHPTALRRVVGARVLWGNAPSTLVRVRDPAELARVLSAAGVKHPRLLTRAPVSEANKATRWLLKPRASGGGHGISLWRPGRRVSRHQVLQERIAGSPASVLFVGDGRNAVPFGLTKQLIGDRNFGAPPFRYCGTLLPSPDEAEWRLDSTLGHAATSIAEVVTRGFGLVGVNGADLIVRRNRPTPIEVNPRFTAAMELVERRDGMSVFAAHVAGCLGQLNDVSTPQPPPRAGSAGKAIVFARQPVTARDTHEWRRDPDIRDIPPPDTHIGRGSPICSVFARGGTTAECYDRLTKKAKDIYATLDRSQEQI
jgi:uncharacterized protein